MWKPRVITSDGIFRALAAGGQIQYRPVKRGKKWEWEVWACFPDEPFIHVISSKTGEPRMFKSADALFSFHLRTFPDETGVFIPATIITTHEWDDPDAPALPEDENGN